MAGKGAVLRGRAYISNLTPATSSDFVVARRVDNGRPSSPLLTDHLGTPIHVVFSTDCSDFLRWQSYLLFYSALRSRQPGTVTQIASSCSEKEERSTREWFEEHVAVMSDRFGLHVAPHFARLEDEKGETVGYKCEF